MLILAGEAGTTIEAPHWTPENHSRLRKNTMELHAPDPGSILAI
jgi:hypothetical protein